MVHGGLPSWDKLRNELGEMTAEEMFTHWAEAVQEYNKAYDKLTREGRVRDWDPYGNVKATRYWPDMEAFSQELYKELEERRETDEELDWDAVTWGLLDVDQPEGVVEEAETFADRVKQEGYWDCYKRSTPAISTLQEIVGGTPT